MYVNLTHPRNRQNANMTGGKGSRKNYGMYYWWLSRGIFMLEGAWEHHQKGRIFTFFPIMYVLEWHYFFDVEEFLLQQNSISNLKVERTVLEVKYILEVSLEWIWSVWKLKGTRKNQSVSFKSVHSPFWILCISNCWVCTQELVAMYRFKCIHAKHL